MVHVALILETDGKMYSDQIILCLTTSLPDPSERICAIQSHYNSEEFGCHCTTVLNYNCTVLCSYTVLLSSFTWLEVLNTAQTLFLDHLELKLVIDKFYL